MFNVYPVTLHYTRTPAKGVLKGMPLKCSFGCASRNAALKSIEQLKQNRRGDELSNFWIEHKK